MKKIVLLVGLVLLVVVGWYFISPFFNNVEVNDAAPTNTLIRSGVENLSPEERAAMDEAMKEANEGKLDPMEEPKPTTGPVVKVISPVMGTVGHPAEGTVQVIETDTGTVVRFENFSTINGPRLHLYLAKDLGATEYIDLGPIRGTSGNINYQIPDGVDISEYRYVMYWCVPFNVLFNYADISTQ